jgi:NarL family two-component system sensor histidine kinase LiaS
MDEVQQRVPALHLLRRPWRQLLFFRRLQWKLTLAYALSTVVTVLVLGVIGLGLLWYLNFWSSWLPNLIADSLVKAGPFVAPYLEQTPPDREGLNTWLRDVIADGNLVINIPADEGTDRSSKLPANFGPVVFIAIVDTQGQVLAEFPAEKVTPGTALPAQIPPEAVAGFQAALRGETNPAMLATRTADNHIVATAPIWGDNKQLLGAIFVELAWPIEQGEFLQLVLQQTILPVGLAMLVVGLVAGVFFGFFIARGFTRRLRALAGAADAWSQGNFEMLVQDNSGDELGQLVRRLNHMAMQLQTLLQTRQELATLEERNRLARDLHDSVKQQVFATSMQVGAALALFEQNPTAAKTRLVETERLVRQAQQELTGLIQELRPAALEDKGLTTALREYVADWSRQSNIAAEVRVRSEQSLPLLLEQTLFRVTQETLSNIARHSGATAMEVYLAWEGDQVTLTISDNGRGFNPATANGKGVGLRSMRERVEAVGGQLTVTSQPGAGTQVMVCIKRNT